MIKIFIVILIINFISLAQQVTVKDSITLQPLELVSVYAEDLNIALFTGYDGKAHVNRIDESKKIIFSLLGYETKELSYEELKAINFIVLLKETPVIIDEVFISVNKWEEKRSEIPNKVESIGLQEIQFTNPQTTADMLAASGGVYVQKSQLGGGSPMIRGFATNRVLIVVDGVRMNTAIFRSGNLQNVISLDANSLTSAEVIFGPGSVIYGSDAIGGVMNFNTFSPRFSDNNSSKFNASAFTRYSSANNEKTGHVHFNIALKNWAFLSSFTYSDFDDLTMGVNGPDEYLRNIYQERIKGKDTILLNDDPEKQIHSGYNQINFMQKIRFNPGNNGWDFNYAFHYSTSSDVPRYDRLIQPENNVLRSAQWYYGPQKWMMNQLHMTNSNSNSLFDLSKIVLAFQNFEESRHDRRFGRNLLNHRIEKVNAFSLNLDLLKELNDNSQLFYGGEIILNNISSTAESENIVTGEKGSISTRYPDGSTWNSYGFYLTYKNKLSSSIILNGGLRFNAVNISAEFDTTFFPFPFTKAELNTSSFNGSLGLVFHPQNDLQINLNLSTGFRAPNIDDVGKVFDSEPGSVVVPNPDLKPEYAYNAELSLIKLFSDKVKIDLTGFYTYLHNALVRRDFQLNGNDSIFYDGSLSQVQAIQNAAHAFIYGIEAGIDIKLPAGLQLSAELNIQNGEEEDDAGDKVPLRHAAPLFGNVHLTYSAERFKADFYTIFNGEISYDNLTASERSEVYLYALDKNGNPYSPGWYTLNFKVTYSALDFLHLNFGIENITNQRYRLYSSGISAAGTNFIGSARVNF